MRAFLAVFLTFCTATCLIDTQPAQSQSSRNPATVSSSGSGFFVSPEGHVLTNYHVIEDCSQITIERAGSGATDVTVVAKDRSNDLALLRSSIKSMVVPAFRSYTRLGENIYVFGFPVFPFLSSSGNFTAGTVTALAGPRDDSGLVQISAPVQPGNSGGPLLDKYGNVVGVVVGKIDALQNVNFAIKSGIVLNFLFSNRAATKQVEASRELPSEEIAELANSFSVRVLCYNAPKPSGIAQGTNPSGEPRQGIGGPYVPVPPDAIIGSYWTYNESLFALQWSGENRKFVYEKPRANLVSMGVTKGTVLFDGKKEGDIYVGTAHTFSQSCGATPYPVRGNITDDLLVTLRGQLPVLDDACKVRRYQDNVLKFRYRGKSP